MAVHKLRARCYVSCQLMHYENYSLFWRRAVKSAAPWLSLLSQLYGARVTCGCCSAEPCLAEGNLVCLLG